MTPHCKKRNKRNKSRRPADRKVTRAPKAGSAEHCSKAVLDPQIVEQVHFGALKTLGRAGLTVQDLPDLKQELLAFVLRAEPKFDPAKATKRTFYARVIANGASKLVRTRRALKRKQRATSLDVPGQEGACLGDQIEQHVHQVRLGRSPRSNEEQAELKLDVDQFVDGLPDRLRVLAERLKNKSVAQIARDLGVPRTTLYGLVGELRERLEAADFRKYLR